MFRNTSVKKSLILVVALLMLALVVLAACDKGDFKPVTIPQAGSEVDSNGGIAVRYGEWLYYVNGYTSDTSADNTYSDEVKSSPRIGSVVRIKVSEIEDLFAIYDKEDNLTTSQKNEEIANAVRGKVDGIKGAETVIPKIYYSGNTDSTAVQHLTGLFIFSDRIYVTTPNDELTPGGDTLVSQLVLTSFKLDGSDMKRHYTFTNNAAQIWLEEVGEGASKKLVATYLMDSILHTLDVASGKDTVVSLADDPKPDVSNTVSSVKWDIAGKCVFFLDKFGSICKLDIGATEYEVVVANETYVDHDDHIEKGSITYTIKSANLGQVYYTVADSNNPSISNVVLYWADSAENNGNVASKSSTISSIIGWKDGIVVYTKPVQSGKNNEITLYGLYRDSVEYEEPVVVLSPEFNENSITIEKIVGDILYYKANNISYKLNLSEAPEDQKEGTPYAKSLSSATGWAYPDFLDVVVDAETTIHYVITMGTGTISIAKFDVTKKTTGTAISLLLKAAE